MKKEFFPYVQLKPTFYTVKQYRNPYEETKLFNNWSEKMLGKFQSVLVCQYNRPDVMKNTFARSVNKGGVKYQRGKKARWISILW